MIMRRGNGTMVSDYAINIQTDSSKIQNDKQEDQSNKRFSQKINDTNSTTKL